MAGRFEETRVTVASAVNETQIPRSSLPWPSHWRDSGILALQVQ